MKWFLLAIMSITYNGGKEIDTFIWSNPTFESVQECIEYVKNNNTPIYMTLKRQFPNDQLDKLFCISENDLKKFIELNEKAKQGEGA